METKSVKVFTKNEEDRFWETGTFNTDIPQGLQNTVFFYVGKVCCLCGGQEQQELKISQFVQYTNPERYVYNEHGS